MPPEIADSDAESDIEINEDTTRHKTPSATRDDLQVYADPTQKLSGLSSSTHKGTSSTERLMRGIHEAAYDGSNDELLASSVATTSSKAKRTLSEVQNTANDILHEPKAKRSKTYGSKTRDVGPDLFADIRSTLEEPPTAARSKDDPNERSSAPTTEMSAPATTTRERDRPRRVISLLQQNVTNPNHQVTTSMSSVGGYQSINLDFRGDGRGLDLDTNPFGSISQVSVEGPPDAAEIHRDLSNTQEHQLTDLLADLAHSQQMMTSPARPPSPVRPVFEPLSEGEPGEVDMPTPVKCSVELGDVDRPSKRSKTEHTPSNATMPPPESTVRRATSVSTEVPSTDLPAPKKRGRPAKAKAHKEADCDGLQTPKSVELYDALPQARPRAGTMEESSQTSQASQLASNTKRKRKQTKAEPVQEMPKQHPSSELNLSDEQLIGLPKENYKPRPSRSRSKRTDDGDDTQHSVTTPAKTAEIEATPVSKPSTVKSKKSKVKRAKTSAAALLKAAEPMLSEGEEDVLWVDSKPAAVKLDLPPDLRVLKKEQAGIEDESADELQSDVGPPKQTFRLDIPAHPDGPLDATTDKKTPKKRGRKPKKASAAAAEVSEIAAASPVDQPAEVEEDNSDRPPLASMDVNKPTPSKNGKKSSKSKAIITDSDDEDENEPPTKTTSQSKPTSIVPPTITTTPSPTKPTITPPKPTHSPLKTTTTIMTTSSNSTGTPGSRYRIGLSKRTKIPSLLRKVQRDKPPPTKTGVKVKELKIKGVNDGGADGDGDGEGEGGEGGEKWTGVLRDKEGRLVEWDF